MHIAGYGLAVLEVRTAEAHGVAQNQEARDSASPSQDETAAIDEYFIPISQVTADENSKRGTAKLVLAKFGTVEKDREEPEYIGAQAHTNNTGELSAMYYALQNALTRPVGAGAEDIHSDSLYAINMTKGKWMPKVRGRGTGKRNAGMIKRLRTLWRRLQRKRPGEVELRHVRSHTMVPGNEIADYLAEQGTHGCVGLVDHLAGARRWVKDWLATAGDGNARAARAGGAGPGGGPPPPPPNTIGDQVGVG